MAKTKLPSETWGEAVARAWRHAGASGRKLAPAISAVYMNVSYRTLYRNVTEAVSVPDHIDSIQLAGLSLAALGYDPADFDLPVDGHLIYMQPKVVAAVRARLNGTTPPRSKNTCSVIQAVAA